MLQLLISIDNLPVSWSGKVDLYSTKVNMQLSIKNILWRSIMQKKLSLADKAKTFAPEAGQDKI